MSFELHWGIMAMDKGNLIVSPRLAWPAKRIKIPINLFIDLRFTCDSYNAATSAVPSQLVSSLSLSLSLPEAFCSGSLPVPGLLKAIINQFAHKYGFVSVFVCPTLPCIVSLVRSAIPLLVLVSL